MPSPDTRELSITKSDGTVVRLAIVADSLLPAGKRAISRNYRAANSDDPGRRRRVEWQLGGEVSGVPVGSIGASIESGSGYLGIDFTRNIETRWDRRMTSAGKQNSLTLTGFDPPATEDAIFGETYFGDVDAPFGSPIAGGEVVVFVEQNDYLLVARGRLLTQVDMTTDPWTVVSTTVLGADVRDADHWRGNAYLALGPTAPLVRVVGASSGGVTLEDVAATSPAETVYASAVKRGSDRAWYINANQTQSSFNFAGYSFGAFVTLADPFQVGDPDVGTTGIGPFGAFTQFGSEDGIYSFTDQGKPIPLSRALTAIHSDLNGKQFADPGWRWNYYTAITGLRANSGGTDNPVGIGERMRAFTGHDGIPQAVWQARGEMEVVYQDSADDNYAYRCTFGPSTGGTGQPLLWPWFYDSTENCKAIYTSTVGVPNEQGIWLIRGDGTNLTYELIAANGRDDIYSDYEYSTAGGTAYLTTLDRDANLLKVLRLARVRARQMSSGDSWTVGFAFDPDPTNTVGATYVSLDAVTSSGAHTLIPDNGTPTGQGNPSPTANISGYSIKPRIVQVAAGADSETSPPELVGTLEVEYDERPELVQEVEVVINITGTAYTDNNIWALLAELMSDQTNAPLRIQIPDDLPAGVPASAGGGQAYGMVNNVVNRTDLKGDNVQAVGLVFTLWPQEAAI